MKRFPLCAALSGALMVSGFMAPSTSQAITIVFDYSYDTLGFFSGANSGRRDILEAAASVFSSRLTDSFAAITPGAGSSWTAAFFDPANPSATINVSNRSIAADTIVIYAGAADLGGTTLGLGGFGGYGYSTPSQAFADAVVGRGQAGAVGAAASRTDFGTWGGSISFSSTYAFYFDSDPRTVESFPGQSDFYSVALHELGHVLGFGTSSAWDNRITGGTFNGTYAGTFAVSPDGAHVASGIVDVIDGTSIAQESAMSPSLMIGTRKEFTSLDYGVMADLGWEVTGVNVSAIPEPATWAGWLGGVMGAVALYRRRRS